MGSVPIMMAEIKQKNENDESFHESTKKVRLGKIFCNFETMLMLVSPNGRSSPEDHLQKIKHP